MQKSPSQNRAQLQQRPVCGVGVGPLPELYARNPARAPGPAEKRPWVADSFALKDVSLTCKQFTPVSCPGLWLVPGRLRLQVGFVNGSVSFAQRETSFSSLAAPPAWPASDKCKPGDASGVLLGKSSCELILSESSSVMSSSPTKKVYWICKHLVCNVFSSPPGHHVVNIKRRLIYTLGGSKICPTDQRLGRGRSRDSLASLMEENQLDMKKCLRSKGSWCESF